MSTSIFMIKCFHMLFILQIKSEFVNENDVRNKIKR